MKPKQMTPNKTPEIREYLTYETDRIIKRLTKDLDRVPKGEMVGHRVRITNSVTFPQTYELTVTLKEVNDTK